MWHNLSSDYVANMHSFFLLALISAQWVLVGYTLDFGPDVGGLGLQGVGAPPNGDYETTVPHGAFAICQVMFSVIRRA